jgi:hypothetical protein
MRKREVSLVGALVICAVAIIARQLFKLHHEKDAEQKAIDANRLNVPGL